MQSFGFKVVDRNAPEIRPIIEHALEAGRPVEVGLYFDDPDARELMTELLGPARLPVNTHLDHAVLNILCFEQHKTAFAHAIERSQRLGATYSITHLAAYPVSFRPTIREQLLSTLLSNLGRLDALCAELDHHVYIENTFHGLGLYRALFDRIQQEELRRIQFCLDIGHAKLWSSETLAQWLEFSEQLRAKGFRLHFHLHQNRGLSDDHLSFLEAEALGLNARDDYSGPQSYLDVLGLIAAMFPESPKVFEVEPQVALANMDFVIERLSQFESEAAVHQPRSPV